MNESEMRIAIALAAGFQRKETPAGFYFYNPDHPLCPDGRVLWDEEELPDYLNDLNAMHEAELAGLTVEQATNKYFFTLMEVCEVPPNIALYEAARTIIFATAAQRAEAFLRTLGLWPSDRPQPLDSEGE